MADAPHEPGNVRYADLEWGRQKDVVVTAEFAGSMASRDARCGLRSVGGRMYPGGIPHGQQFRCWWGVPGSIPKPREDCRFWDLHVDAAWSALRDAVSHGREFGRARLHGTQGPRHRVPHGHRLHHV